jgi:hypothetical protein
MKASIINQLPLRLIAAKSESFPDGNREAFASIETHLTTLKGRRFYGVVYESAGEMDYYAGLVPDSEVEERRFSELGFLIREIEGGVCARVKLLNWMSKADQIGPAFGALIDEYGIDPSRPQLEFYRSLTELHLLLPVPSEHPKTRSK